jgi:hypothetical protein
MNFPYVYVFLIVTSTIASTFSSLCLSKSDDCFKFDVDQCDLFHKWSTM